jgi:hypothetical protein
MGCHRRPAVGVAELAACWPLRDVLRTFLNQRTCSRPESGAHDTFFSLSLRSTRSGDGCFAAASAARCAAAQGCGPRMEER